jgi:hypothetical protein
VPSGPAGLGKCASKGYWCGKAAGAPSGAALQTLYYCPAAGVDWYKIDDCSTCYSCPSGTADTCDAATAMTQGCK